MIVSCIRNTNFCAQTDGLSRTLRKHGITDVIKNKRIVVRLAVNVGFLIFLLSRTVRSFYLRRVLIKSVRFLLELTFVQRNICFRYFLLNRLDASNVSVL